MLVRFVISNYLSFGEETEFNMLTGSVRRKKEHIYQFGDIELLKTAAIYGPNGAGKSNFVGAVHLLQLFVVYKWSSVTSQFKPFKLGKQFSSKPTEFEIEFLKNSKMYIYGISIFEGKILKEWLYQTSNRKEELIFSRKYINGKTKINFNDNKVSSEEDKLRIKLYEEELLENTTPLLRKMALAKKKFEEIKDAYNWFSNDLHILYPVTKSNDLIINYQSDKTLQSYLNSTLKTLGTGIHELKYETFGLEEYYGKEQWHRVEEIEEEMPKDKSSYLRNYDDDSIAVWENDKIVIKRLITTHKNDANQSFEFDIHEESDGTKRLLDFLPIIYEIINNQKTVIIDEIDQSIH
ncbi:MAG: ATP/GTP-binding protein, partial [Saprospiraceae bacterium]